MKHLTTSKQMSRVFRGLVLALALILVACGGDADEPTPTASTDDSQVAQPTVALSESTPDTQVSEDEITVLAPEIPATPEVSTPEALDVEGTPATDEEAPSDEMPATPDQGPVDLTQTDEAEEVDVASTPDEAEAPVTQSTPTGVAESSPAEATPPPSTESTPPATDEVTDEEAGSTERARTGNETFDHPGDGTGGSGMPGENGVNEPEDATDETPSATPAASPIAQLEISGCDVPDVPGYLGDTSTFILTVDVNFRSGPGVDCDPLMDEPLGEGQIVEVTGGPVTQADDGSEWVQIEIEGEPGWITTEFIEPAE